MRWKYLLPQHWPTWFAAGLVRAMGPLPFRMQLGIGAALGSVARWVLPAHVRVARRNLALCFPEKSAAEREVILRAHFRSLGMAVGEAAAIWWQPPERLRALTQIEGLEHVDRALAEGHGLIALTAHFTTIEIAGGIMGAVRAGHVVYKPAKDPLMTEILIARRRAYAGRVIANDDIRSMIRALKANEGVWYAPDQAYRKKGAEMVPFFGIPVATNTATSRLARMTGARVLPMFSQRLPNGQGYRITFHPPFENFPSADSVADTRRFHELIEAHVRRVPEQYLWVHRRFKGLEENYPDYYA